MNSTEIKRYRSRTQVFEDDVIYPVARYSQPCHPSLRRSGAPDLYDMVTNPVVNIIKKNVTNAVILTPSITGNGESWMVDWVCEEGTNTLLSNVYDIHEYMGNRGTPELAYQNVMPGPASSPGLLYPYYFPIRIKY